MTITLIQPNALLQAPGALSAIQEVPTPGSAKPSTGKKKKGTKKAASTSAPQIRLTETTLGNPLFEAINEGQQQVGGGARAGVRVCGGHGCTMRRACVRACVWACGRACMGHAGAMQAQLCAELQALP